MLGLHCRDIATGLWYNGPHIDKATGELCFRDANTGQVRSVPFTDLLNACRRAVTGAEFPAVIMLPNLWRPPSATPSLNIANVARRLVSSLQSGDILLSDLSWQQLEDVVAEILSQKGFDIQMTARSKDGGRDIIARGELVPGEVCVVAVEVKHRRVVKVPEIRSHLQANSQFPMLLVATSGRFTAGVVREKMKPENFLRLHLRDQAAISSWIAAYKK